MVEAHGRLTSRVRQFCRQSPETLLDITDIAALDSVTTEHALKRLYRYWADRRSAREFPSRADIDPVEFGYALGRVSLIDVLEDPRRFRYRVVSTMLTEHLGYEMTGRFLDELPAGEMRAYTERLYTHALARRLPIYETDGIVLDGWRWSHEALVLPLSSDGQRIDMLMVYRITRRPERRDFDR
jgi:hypothetical protein